MSGTEITTTAQYLINICDCVSIGQKGDPIVRIVFEKYPYANCYTSRLTTTKSLPGTSQLTGDGKTQRYIINMFAQFYPGAPKYPCDNITKRCEWFSNCLNQLLKIKDLKSLAFPPNIGVYENINLSVKYLDLIDDFKKKFYLKNKYHINITDYNNTDILQVDNNQNIIYDTPMGILGLSENDFNQVPAIKKSFKIIKHINIQDLVYIDPNQATTAAPQAPEPTSNKVKIELRKKEIKPPQTINEPTISVPIPLRIYDKNPTWTKRISELINDVDPSWKSIFSHPTMTGLITQLDQEFNKELEGFGDFMEILPTPQENIFNAFKKCKYPIKGLIMGQDCYAEKINQAMGLAFSVQPNVPIPPSLVNIFKELKEDITGFNIPQSGDLTKWAEQGILLLNASLTVRHGQKESHLKIWKPFINQLIQLISENNDNPIVFMLWGNFAKNKQSLITNQSKHLILTAGHPSPLSANQGIWFGCRHFSQCNQFLQQKNIPLIKWDLS